MQLKTEVDKSNIVVLLNPFWNKKVYETTVDGFEIDPYFLSLQSKAQHKIEQIQGEEEKRKLKACLAEETEAKQRATEGERQAKLREEEERKKNAGFNRASKIKRRRREKKKAQILIEQQRQQIEQQRQQIEQQRQQAETKAQEERKRKAMEGIYKYIERDTFLEEATGTLTGYSDYLQFYSPSWGGDRKLTLDGSRKGNSLYSHSVGGAMEFYQNGDGSVLGFFQRNNIGTGVWIKIGDSGSFPFPSTSIEKKTLAGKYYCCEGMRSGGWGATGTVTYHSDTNIQFDSAGTKADITLTSSHKGNLVYNHSVCGSMEFFRNGDGSFVGFLQKRSGLLVGAWIKL